MATTRPPGESNAQIAARTTGGVYHTFSETVSLTSLGLPTSLTDYTLRLTADDPGNGNIAFDNFTVTTIPEPTSSALLGLGSLALLAKRRR